MIEGQAAVHQCNATVDFMEKTFMPYPTTVNDVGVYTLGKKVGEQLLGAPRVILSPMVMGAEDFSFYTQKMPSAFFSLGVRNESIGAINPLHSPLFVLDENALPIGAALHTAVALSYLDPSALGAGVRAS